MSGAEFIAVAAVTSSIIAIVDGITNVLQAASDAQGLPKVFRQAQSKLEIISDILDATTAAFEKSGVSGIDSTVQKTIDNCQNSWQKLKVLFERVIPDEDASRMERYRKAARTLGKGSKVETLMKDLMENVRLLATLKTMTEGKEKVIQTNPKKEKLEGYIAEVAKWEPSLPDHVFDEGGHTMQVSGSGHNVSQGENAQQFISRDHAQNIGVINGGYHNNVSHNALVECVTTEGIDQACLHFLQCPDTWAIKNRLQETKDGLVFESIKWIFQDRQYTDWKNKDKLSLLLIKGGAGKGKTMLSIGLIEELSTDAAVTYFFCQNANYELNTLEAIMKGLILCLVNQRKETVQVLRNHWKAKPGFFTKSTPAWRTLWDIFLGMLERCECSRVYVIVDALDECQDDMGDFLKLLVRTGLGRPSKIKWLLTSRPLDTAQRELLAGSNQALVSLEANSRLVAVGISAYITKKVAELSNRNNYGPEFRQEIKNQLTQKAEDTYMWASLVCKRLENVHRSDALATIENLPAGLYPFYNRALNQLNSGEPALVRGCMRLLKAMMLAYRPLNIAELGIVSGLSEELITYDRLIDRCSSFVKRQGHTETIEFVHQSARDYLAGSQGQSLLDAKERYGHGEIALSCLSYLSQQLKINLADLPRPDSTRQSMESNPLVAKMGYAASFWAQHLYCAKQTVPIQVFLSEQGELGAFLRTKLLPWLECLCLLDKLSHALEALRALEDVVNGNHSLSTLVRDATFFLSQNYQTIKIWPLQLYSSGIVFSLQKNMIRRENQDNLPKWLRKMPQIEERRASPIQTFNTGYWVNCIAFSPDGKTLASIYDGTIELWDVGSGNHQKTIVCLNPTQYFGFASEAIAFSPDGKQIASGHNGANTIQLQNITTEVGRILFKDDSHSYSIRAITFSPDGQRVAFGFDNTLKVCDAITGDIQMTLNASVDGGHQVLAVVFSPDGRQIAVGCGYYIKLWDVTTGDLQKELINSDSFYGTVLAVTFLPDGKQIATASNTNIRVWDIGTEKYETKFQYHSLLVAPSRVTFSFDGKQIAAASNRTIWLWDITTIDIHREFEDHLDTINNLTISPDGKQVASSRFTTIKLWDTTTGRIQRTLKHQMLENCLYLKFSSDSKQIISGSSRTIMLWDALAGDCQKRFQDHSTKSKDIGWPTAVAFSPNGKKVARGSQSGNIILWDATTGTLQRELKGHEEKICIVVFSPNCEQIASGSSDATIKLWNTRTGDLQMTLKYADDFLIPSIGLAFSPDGKQIASNYYGEIYLCSTKPSTIQRWINPTRPTIMGKLEAVIPKDWAPGFLKFSEDGRHVITHYGQIRTENILTNGRKPYVHLFEDLGLRDGWIYYGEMRLLRLPPEFEITAGDISGDIVAIALRDDRVISFNFDRERLRLMLENPT